jgi:hypothetical protein
LVIAAVAAIGVYKSTAHPGPAPQLTVEARGPDQDPMAMAGDQAARAALKVLQGCAGKPATMTCGLARARVLVHMEQAFETVTDGYDPSVIGVALASLDSTSTLLQAAAVRYLGRVAVPDAEHQRATISKLVALIADSRSLEVGGETAHALLGSALRDVGQRWLDHHKDFPHDELTLAYHRPVATPDLAQLGFKIYDPAIPYSPADTDRSLGYATHDSLDKVLAFFAKQAGAQAMDQASWQAFFVAAIQRETNPAANQPSAADLAEIRRLQQEYQRTKDPAQMQQAAAIMTRPKPLGPLGSRKPNAMITGVYLRHVDDRPAAFVVKRLPDHVALMVFVYPEPSIHATVIEYAWSLVEADPLTAP